MKTELFNEDGTWKRNDSYTSILQLDKMLTSNNIPHTLIEFMDGWQILYFDSSGNRVGDVVEHYGSYGHESDLMEVYGFCLPEPSGWLSVEETFEFFKNVHDKGE